MKAGETERTDRRGIALAMGQFESLGFAFREQTVSDYGIDAHVELIESEQPTGRLLGIQIKTGPSYLSKQTDEKIVFRTDAAHVNYWINHALPVIICLCDADNQKIYWHSVTKETAISTGKGFKFIVPMSQILNEESIPQVRDLLAPLVSPDRYTIFKTEDVSNGLAKRYSFSVVVNGTASKAEIGFIVRQVTIEGAKRRYHRNHVVKDRWGDADAHVVWTLVYQSAEDQSRCNHICHSLWINESLDDAARPLPIKGENIGDDIFVNWSDDYDLIAQHTATNTLTKEDYLNTVVPLIEELKQLFQDFESQVLLLKAGDINEDIFLAESNPSRQRISQIYNEICGMALAPFECNGMDDRLECFIACMVNIVSYYSDKGRETWSEPNRLDLSLQQRACAREHLGELEYEMKKIR